MSTMSASSYFSSSSDWTEDSSGTYFEADFLPTDCLAFDLETDYFFVVDFFAADLFFGYGAFFLALYF
ncbi:MAG: hypothetical protein ACMG6E_02830 [Candidatus Roizmanbacteria bacterium]